VHDRGSMGCSCCRPPQEPEPAESKAVETTPEVKKDEKPRVEVKVAEQPAQNLEYKKASLVSASSDKRIKIWDYEKEECLATFTGHTDWVLCVIVLSNRQIVSSSKDKTIRIWDSRTTQCITTLQGHTQAVRVVIATRDEKLIISGSKDQTIKIWSGTSCVTTLKGSKGEVTCLTTVMIGKNERLISGSHDDDKLKIWSLSSPYECLTTWTAHSFRLSCLGTLQPSKHGEGRIVSGSFDEKVKVWDVTASPPKCLHTCDQGSDVMALCVLASGHVASAGFQKTIKIWNPSTGECLHVINTFDTIKCVTGIPPTRASEGGCERVAVSKNQNIQLWQYKPPKGLCILLGHVNAVNSLALLEP